MDLLAVTGRAYLSENEAPPSSVSSRVFKSSSVADWFKKEESKRLKKCIDDDDDDADAKESELRIKR